MNLKKTMLAASTAAMILGAALPGTANAAACSVSDVQVTSVGQFSSTSADATMTTYNIAPMDAAACAGGYDGNDMPKPTINLGYAGDGLLNGALQTPSGDDLFPGGAFITDEYPTSDLRGDGTADDPGWVMLGRIDFNRDGTGTFVPEAVGGDTSIVLASFFTVTSNGDGTGTWAFTPDAAVASRTEALFGKNYFDQFALVFKQAREFAAYDFTAAQFGVAHPSVDVPIFHFGGTFDISKTLGRGLSHVSLWARDPASLNTVPEPGVLGLLGLAALGLAGVRRRFGSR